MVGQQEVGQSKFAWTCIILQITFAILFLLLVRYEESEEDDDGHHGHHFPFEKYPAFTHINMMLVGGFGFLMTFLKRFGFSALGMTLLVVVLTTEWSILLWGFTKLDSKFTIHVNMMEVLEASLTSAAVLISFGALLGKLNPLQTLILAMIESAVFTANAYIGYKVLKAVDVGGSIFIHAFGAYYGLAVSFIMRKKNYKLAADLEGSKYQSDVWAMIGTVLLWIYWPSFNAILATDDAAFERAVLNTYISLLASTVCTFFVSTLVHGEKKLDMVHIQNGTLSGGVAVGAIADLYIQPYGAIVIGSLTGTISTLGYHLLQPRLYRKLGIHDTCGVNNLHGMPGLISGFISIFMCYVAIPSDYNGLFTEGRSMTTQALIQIAVIGITLFLALIGGLLTGVVLEVSSLFHPPNEREYFNDENYWILESEDDESHGNPSKAKRQSRSFSEFTDIHSFGGGK